LRLPKFLPITPTSIISISSNHSPRLPSAYRTRIAYSKDRRAVFLLGFAKYERENIDPKQLADLKAAATDILSPSDHALDVQIEEGRLQELDYDQEEDEG